MLLGTLRGTQIHPYFCKSLIANGFGKEGWLWGGKYASHRSRRPSPSYGYEGTEARRPRGGGPGDGETERRRSRARTWQATERNACNNGNMKGGGGKAGNQGREAWL